MWKPGAQTQGSVGPKIGSQAGKNARPWRWRLPLTIGSHASAPVPWLWEARGHPHFSSAAPWVSYPARFGAQHKKGDLLCGHERFLTATQKSPGRNIPFGGPPHVEFLCPTPTGRNILFRETPSLLLSRPGTKYLVQGDPPTPFIAPKDEISRAGKGGSTVCYCQGHVDRKDQ